uniref:Disease resistance protein At4g27190-like n=1 Tax=Nicotiana sylvestris TaxID=4096 RepID=A0A1U7XVD5_NICSY|nr:PREDICTED: disease resistance protein At4g27190-like [Nicotiana sylvestris]
MIEILKDACLLEGHEWDSVKMHDVVRDVAIWIDNSLGKHNSLIQAGLGLSEISHIKMSASVKRMSFVSNKIERLPDSFMECPETTTLLLQDNRGLAEIPDTFFLAFPALRVLNLSGTDIRALPSSINSLYQLRALILIDCRGLTELPPIGNLCNLQLLDCDDIRLHRLPQGMDKLTDLSCLTAIHLKSIDQGILLKLASIEMIDVLGCRLLSTCFDELSSLQKLTSLYIRLDRSSVSNRDHTWMSRLKSFHIVVGEDFTWMPVEFYSSPRTITISNCEIFSKGELSGMLQFASNLYLVNCMGLRKLIAYNSFSGIKQFIVHYCDCDFKPAEEGSGRFDPLPNLEYLCLAGINNLESVSDISHLLGLRFSKLCRLDISDCHRLRCLFNVGGAFSVPNHMEHIKIHYCTELVELFVQCGSSQTTLVNSEIPRVRKFLLSSCPKLRTLGEPENMWEHLDELSLTNCNQIKKLPLSIQTSKNVKGIRGESKWWNQLEWDSDNFKSNLEHCFQPVQY